MRWGRVIWGNASAMQYFSLGIFQDAADRRRMAGYALINARYSQAIVAAASAVISATS
jgi:hypothetical protein